MSTKSFPVEERALSEALAQVVSHRAERTPPLSLDPQPNSVQWQCENTYEGLSVEESYELRSDNPHPQYWTEECCFWVKQIADKREAAQRLRALAAAEGIETDKTRYKIPNPDYWQWEHDHLKWRRWMKQEARLEQEAHLEETRLEEARLEEARLEEARLEEARLEKARLEQEAKRVWRTRNPAPGHRRSKRLQERQGRKPQTRT